MEWNRRFYGLGYASVSSICWCFEIDIVYRLAGRTYMTLTVCAIKDISAIMILVGRRIVDRTGRVWQRMLPTGSYNSPIPGNRLVQTIFFDPVTWIPGRPPFLATDVVFSTGTSIFSITTVVVTTLLFLLLSVACFSLF